MVITASLDAAKLAAKLDVTAIPAGTTTITITRTSPSGNTAGVRGAVARTIAATTFTIRDYEIPLGTSVTYKVTVTPGSATATTTFAITYTSCEAWLVDLARPTNSQAVTIESLQALAFPVPAGIHRVLNRRAPVVTSLPAYTPAAELSVLTETLQERDAVRYTLGSGYPFLLRTAPEQGIGNLYLAPTEFVEERIAALGTLPARRFRAGCVQIQRPDPAIYVPIAPNTYANVKATYATYSALRAGVASYDALAYTYPPGQLNPTPPWLPDDV